MELGLQQVELLNWLSALAFDRVATIASNSGNLVLHHQLPGNIPGFCCLR